MPPRLKVGSVFRFSLAALFVAMAYIATNVQAYMRPDSYWPEVAFYWTVGLLLVLVAVSCGATRPATVFARGMVLSLVLFGFCQEDEPAYNDAERPTVFNWAILMPANADFLDDVRRPVLERGNRVAFGIFGGSLALWHYSITTRRRAKSLPAQ